MSKQDCTTYCIYRIVCFQNAMVYIGQTLDPKKRKRVHFQQLRDNQHVNIHLQAAYNKYGRQAFYFEVIENNIAPSEVDAREQFWINHYDSFRNGFNRTTGGNNGYIVSNPVTWNGITYPNVSEAQRQLGVSLTWRLAQGYTSDEQLKQPGKRVSCTWNGVTYASFAECARALGIDPSTVRDYIQRGYCCDNDLTVQEKPCTWNGITYNTQSEAARANGFSKSYMAVLLRKGYTSSIEKPKRGGNAKRIPCSWNGVNYPSISEAARASGLKVTALHYRLRHGYTCDDDMK